MYGDRAHWLSVVPEGPSRSIAMVKISRGVRCSCSLPTYFCDIRSINARSWSGWLSTTRPLTESQCHRLLCRTTVFACLHRRWVLEYKCDSLTRARAHTEYAVTGFAPTQLSRECEHVSSAGGSEGVADGDRAPVGFRRSSGTSKPSSCRDSSRSIASATEAYASWISQTSTSPAASPARASAFGIANAGAIPMIRGSRACVADETTRASGSTPSSSAALALASTTALAPSFSGEEFPAVIWVVLGWGGSAASFSAVVSSRMLSLCSNRRAGCLCVPGISTGWISAARRPESRAAAARRWERSAKASISSRVSS